MAHPGTGGDWLPSETQIGLKDIFLRSFVAWPRGFIRVYVLEVQFDVGNEVILQRGDILRLRRRTVGRVMPVVSKNPQRLGRHFIGSFDRPAESLILYSVKVIDSRHDVEFLILQVKDAAERCRITGIGDHTFFFVLVALRHVGFIMPEYQRSGLPGKGLVDKAVEVVAESAGIVLAFVAEAQDVSEALVFKLSVEFNAFIAEGYVVLSVGRGLHEVGAVRQSTGMGQEVIIHVEKSGLEIQRTVGQQIIELDQWKIIINQRVNEIRAVRASRR